MNWETILSFGDSITFGARSYLGYPEICGDILSKKLNKNWNVINHSTNGFTTIDLIRSINPVFSGYKEAYPSLITAMIGTNDIKKNVSIDEFEIAYRQLITKLRLLSVNNNIILIKIPRITTDVFYPYNYSMNSLVDKFNFCIESLANQNQLRVMDFKLEDDDFFDGVHFSSKGSNMAASQLTEIILNDKGVASSTTMS